MPELPEAETIVRGLRPHLVGRRFREIAVVRPDVLRQTPSELRHMLEGRAVRAVERRGKNVVVPLTGESVLAVNLGMTGRLLHFESPPPPERAPSHPAVRFVLDGGAVLVFHDVRRFGTVECLGEAAWRERSDRMGPEPLDPAFTPEALGEGLRKSRAPVRSWLLDQRRIAGVGNIYANEALYLAGIDPRTPARQIDAPGATRLHVALVQVLGDAIQAGGTTLRDYRAADGREGDFGRALGVYGRDGRPCARCGTRIERVVFGNRSAFLCPSCQPLRSAASRREGGRRGRR